MTAPIENCPMHTTEFTDLISRLVESEVADHPEEETVQVHVDHPNGPFIIPAVIRGSTFDHTICFCAQHLHTRWIESIEKISAELEYKIRII